MISIIGKYRTGKSFFINQVLLNNIERGDILGEGFNVASSVNPCTKGIWLWSSLLDAKELGLNIDKKVLIMDCEGFGGIDQEQNHNNQVYLLALLMSSYLIYNC